MLKELVKIANKLDALGLSKEADILDSFISKVAEDVEWGGMSKMPEMTPFEKAMDSAAKAKSQAEKAKVSMPPNMGESLPEKDFPEPVLAETLTSYLQRARSMGAMATTKDLIDYYNKFSGGTQMGSSGMQAPPKTGWDKYVMTLKDGGKVKEAWFKYVDSGMPEVDKRFSSYVEWYNSRKRTDWNGEHASPAQVISLLGAEISRAKYGFKEEKA